jgi:hypothetical protein
MDEPFGLWPPAAESSGAASTVADERSPESVTSSTASATPWRDQAEDPAVAGAAWQAGPPAAAADSDGLSDATDPLDRGAVPLATGIPVTVPETLGGFAAVGTELVVAGPTADDIEPPPIEFVGYTDTLAPAPKPAEDRVSLAASPRAPEPPGVPEPHFAPASEPRSAETPTGRITDVARRPPGATPAPSAGQTRSVPAQTASVMGPSLAASRAAASGGGTDVWNVVTATPTAGAIPVAGRASRFATAALTLLVAVVILFLVVGFVVMFTSLL